MYVSVFLFLCFPIFVLLSPPVCFGCQSIFEFYDVFSNTDFAFFVLIPICLLSLFLLQNVPLSFSLLLSLFSCLFYFCSSFTYFLHWYVYLLLPSLQAPSALLPTRPSLYFLFHPFTTFLVFALPSFTHPQCFSAFVTSFHLLTPCVLFHASLCSSPFISHV